MTTVKPRRFARALAVAWSPVALLLAALSPVAWSLAAAEPSPATIEEALAGLETSQAAAATWQGFGIGSYARYRQQTQSERYGVRDESYSETLVRATDEALYVETAVSGTGDAVTLPQSRRSGELAAANARPLGPETVYHESRRYDTQVYAFRRERRISYVIDVDLHTFWLAARVPGGVVKVRHERREINLLDPDRPVRIRKDVETVLTDTDVPIRVGSETLLSYCYQTRGFQGGDPVNARNCFNDRVPGGLVRQEARQQEDGGEDRTATHQLVEFRAVEKEW